MPRTQTKTIIDDLVNAMEQTTCTCGEPAVIALAISAFVRSWHGELFRWPAYPDVSPQFIMLCEMHLQQMGTFK